MPADAGTDAGNLKLIAVGNALPAVVEYDLEERGLMRTILVHLNINLDRADERDVQTISDYVRGALEVGLDPDVTNLDPSQITIALAEEV